MRRLVAVIVASACAGAFAGAFMKPIAGFTPDQRIENCQLGPNGVIAAFDLQRARDIWTYLPAMARAPELENDEPTSVIVYDGEVETLLLGRAGLRRGALTDVVCVLLSNGDRIVYEGVSRTGFRSP